MNSALESLAVLFRQLHMLVAAGVPIVRALEVCRQGVWPGELKAALDGSVTFVNRGERLSTAFNRWPHLFGRETVAMLALGEKTGALVVVLRRLADLLEERTRQQRQLRSALVYPSFVLAVGLLFAGGLLLFFVPRMAALLAGLPGSSPWLATVSAGVALATDPMSLVVALECLGLLALVGWRWLRTVPGRLWAEQLLLSLGPVRSLVMTELYCSFSYSLALMLECGMALQDALALLAQGAPLKSFEEALRGLRGRILWGESLSDALRAQPQVPALLCSMAAVGEDSGRMPFVLQRCHRILAEELRLRVDTALALLEPAVTVTLGGFIGLVALGFFWPLTEVLRNL